DLTIDDIKELKNALLDAVKISDAISDRRNQYGQKYIIDFSMIHKKQSALIHSVWIVRDSENFPRLVTCYVL
ncbi:MAG: DUF6883 domain-containing protein, partial [Microcystaceae cyanobacterium]